MVGTVSNTVVKQSNWMQDEQMTFRITEKISYASHIHIKQHLQNARKQKMYKLEKDQHIYWNYWRLKLTDEVPHVFRTCKLLVIAKHNIHSCTIQYIHNKKTHLRWVKILWRNKIVNTTINYVKIPGHILQINVILHNKYVKIIVWWHKW